MLVDAALYRDGAREPAPADLAAIRARCRPDHVTAWIGLHEPDAAELEQVAQGFDLHPDAVRDAVRPHGRPKLERFGDARLVVLRTARLTADGTLELGELHVLQGPSWVITIRHGPPSALREVRRALDARPDLVRRGPQAVVDAVVDRVVDDLGPVVAGIEERVDELEDDVFDGSPSVSRRIYDLAGEVIKLQRGVRPLVALVDDLGRSRGLGEEEERFLRGVGHHARRVEERAAEARALLQNALSVNLTLETKALAEAANHTNEEVKRISSWAAIFFAPTLVGTIYGMNFEHMPELGWTLGYPLAVALMAALAVGLWVAFRRRGWL